MSLGHHDRGIERQTRMQGRHLMRQSFFIASLHTRWRHDHIGEESILRKARSRMYSATARRPLDVCMWVRNSVQEARRVTECAARPGRDLDRILDLFRAISMMYLRNSKVYH